MRDKKGPPRRQTDCTWAGVCIGHRYGAVSVPGVGAWPAIFFGGGLYANGLFVSVQCVFVTCPAAEKARGLQLTHRKSHPLVGACMMLCGHQDRWLVHFKRDNTGNTTGLWAYALPLDPAWGGTAPIPISPTPAAQPPWQPPMPQLLASVMAMASDAHMTGSSR